MTLLKGGVTLPKGFKANGLSCGIKKSGKPDLALIFSEVPAVAAGVFTKNSVKAAPVIVSKNHLRNNRAQAIIANSGNANCFTGSFGIMYARRSADLIGRLLAVKPADVIVASTGIIGKPLPYKKIEQSAAALVRGLSRSGSSKAAKAILTTDLVTKEAATRLKIKGKTVHIGAIAKGSGMVQPNMATMLAFVTTDLAISKPMLKTALAKAVSQTFNRITIDGCMSTNDMVTMMANGQAGNPAVIKQDKDFKKFTEALTLVCLELAKKIVLDGEGATKFIEVHVKGAKSEQQALKACFTVANSNLVKTAAFGSNPNWGRVAAAIGSLGIASVTEKNLKISFSPFKKKNIQIHVDLNIGRQSATVYTSDLSYEYVRINGEYN